MTFDSRETSLTGGTPIRLYDFYRGIQHWTYTTGALAVTHNLRTYTSAAISDDGIRQTGEDSADAFNIDVPLDLPLLNLYRVYPPSTPVSVTVYDMHIGDAEAVVAWVGSIGDVTYRRDRVRLVCRPLSAEQDTTGLRLTWSRNCPHTLYDDLCQAIKENFRVDAELLSVSGNVVSAAAFAGHADDWFSGGLLEWQSEFGILEQRGIESHTGTDLVLLGGSVDFQPGLVVRAYPGCRRTIQECNDKFGNKDNYGGVPPLPGKSPFDGDPLF